MRANEVLSRLHRPGMRRAGPGCTLAIEILLILLAATLGSLFWWYSETQRRKREENTPPAFPAFLKEVAVFLLVAILTCKRSASTVW